MLKNATISYHFVRSNSWNSIMRWSPEQKQQNNILKQMSQRERAHFAIVQHWLLHCYHFIPFHFVSSLFVRICILIFWITETRYKEQQQQQKEQNERRVFFSSVSYAMVYKSIWTCVTYAIELWVSRVSVWLCVRVYGYGNMITRIMMPRPTSSPSSSSPSWSWSIAVDATIEEKRSGKNKWKMERQTKASSSTGITHKR